MQPSLQSAPRILPAAIPLAAATLLYFVPTSPFYPPCPFHEATGLLCPGCGATRALAALLHGHLTEGLHQNALFVLLLPAILIYALIATRRQSWPVIPTPILFTLLALTLTFTITRNL